VPFDKAWLWKVSSPGQLRGQIRTTRLFPLLKELRKTVSPRDLVRAVWAGRSATSAIGVAQPAGRDRVALGRCRYPAGFSGGY